jgi:hypothetical protein
MNKSITSRQFAVGIAVVMAMLFSGCASVPMTSAEDDVSAKKFSIPEGEKSGLYVFRNSHFGAALKKLISLDGKPLGQTAPMTYFYKEIVPGKHTLTTQAEFGDNQIEFFAEKGKLIFIRNYIKMGTFVGSANVEQVSEEEGKSGVLECSRATAFSQ